MDKKVVLTPEVIGRIRQNLNGDLDFSDEELSNAAYWIVAPVLTAGEQIGISDNGPLARIVLSNLYAGSLLADWINLGLIDVKNITKFLDGLQDDAAKADLAALDESEVVKA